MGLSKKSNAEPSLPGSAFAGRRAACVELADGEPLILLEGHDEALLGVAEIDGEPRAVYDANAIVRRLMRRDGMDREGAWEFFEYNIASAFRGESAPVFVSRLS
jgi:hypothetical protein